VFLAKVTDTHVGEYSSDWFLRRLREWLWWESGAHFSEELRVRFEILGGCSKSRLAAAHSTLSFVDLRGPDAPDDKEKVQEVRAYNETEEFDQRYRKRPKVERKLSELLRRHGLRFGRYLGQKKTELQALLTAAVVNLKRAGTELIERLCPATASTGQMAPATG
jgi:hypothetical protein